MKKLGDNPTCELGHGINATRLEKAAHLRKIAVAVVDGYIIDEKRNKDILQHVQTMEDNQRTNVVDVAGRYPCRANGCPKTFAHDGKLRTDHEASHNPCHCEAALPGICY